MTFKITKEFDDDVIALCKSINYNPKDVPIDELNLAMQTILDKHLTPEEQLEYRTMIRKQPKMFTEMVRQVRGGKMIYD